MLNILSANDSVRQEALALLYSQLPRGEREDQLALALQAVQRGELPLDGLLAATQGGEVIGAVLAVQQPGGAAFLWPPVAHQDDVADALLQAVAKRLDEQGILFTQTLLEQDDLVHREMLARNGFPRAADLLFLRRDLKKPLPDAPPSRLQAIPYDDTRHDRFTRVLEQTYLDSRDCPEVTGLRNGAESLAAHRASGDFAPSNWLLYACDGEEIGVLLLAESEATWEVIYFGVVPSTRGRGYGRMMMLDGLHRAQQAGAQEMQLTVDSGNTPAIAIYKSLGFFRTAIRAVHLRINAKFAR